MVILVGVLLGAIDLACTRLPDVLVMPTFVVSAATLGIIAIAGHDPGPFVRALLAAAAVGGAYFLLAVITGGGFGLGDAKLGLVLGLLLGWFGWPFVLAGVLAAHLMHGLVAVAALLARRAGAGTLIPMGPALLAGAWCAIAVIPIVLLPRG